MVLNRLSEPRDTSDILIDIVENWQPSGWFPLSSFSISGKGAAAFYEETLKWANDQSGIYFIRTKNVDDFRETTNIPLRQRLFYIGRAGAIARRLNRHLKVEKHNSASLVYKITAIGLNRNGVKRNTNMDDNDFLEQFRTNQDFLRQECELSYCLCENNENQALLEIFFWLRFKTAFNDWKTH